MRLLDELAAEFVEKTRRKPSPLVKLLVYGLFHRGYFDQLYRGEANRLGEPMLSLSFDCDYRKDNEAVKEMVEGLATYGIRCDFAVIGKWAEQYAGAYRFAVDNGHDLINHTHTHPDNDELAPGRYLGGLTYAEKKAEISKCHETVKKLVGFEMSGFRTPHYGRQHSQDIYKILGELGYAFSSSVQVNAAGRMLPYREGRVWEMPITVCPRHPLTSFDSFHSFRANKKGKHTEKEFASLFKGLVDKALRENLYVNVYLDPQDVARMDGFWEAIEHMKRSKIRMLKLAEMARLMETKKIFRQ